MWATRYSPKSVVSVSYPSSVPTGMSPAASGFQVSAHSFFAVLLFAALLLPALLPKLVFEVGHGSSRFVVPRRSRA